MKKILTPIVLGVICLWSTSAFALDIYLTNGDKITGVVEKDTETEMIVKTLAFGEIHIDKSFIDRQKTYPEEYNKAPVGAKVVTVDQKTEDKVEWKKNMSFGWTQAGGNTRSRQGNIDASLNRKTKHNETTLKFDSFYSSDNNKMDGKKFYGMARYAYSFGSNLKWYQFYKLEADQDYFAQVEYRLIPAVGRGYWFSDNDDLKALAELALGYQYTNYRLGAKATGDPILIPRFFIDKRLVGKLHLSEDLTMYPSLDDVNNYRFHSETDLINQISERWALKIQYVNDYNSHPPMSGVKKDDYRWITSLQYNF